MPRQVDYLIVGQGLAGTCLAFTLQNYYQKSVIVIDKDAGKYCSKVAAGNYNPLGFRTLGPTWRAGEFLPYLNTFYRDMEKSLSVKLLNDLPVYKQFKNEEQRKQWIKMCDIPPSAQYMSSNILEQVAGLKGNFGFGKVIGSGNLNVSQMINAFRSELSANDSLSPGLFDFNELSIKYDSITYKEIQSKKIVFCQGIHEAYNPLFKNLAFKKSKGEVLIIEVNNFNAPGIIHNGINIVPLNENTFWVGSTFEWIDSSTQSTSEARIKLEEQLGATFSVPFKITDQWAGIRPTVKDRRPLIGAHANHKNVFYFNGLGTRGVMLAPTMAKELTYYMEEGLELNKEVNLSRFNELM